MVLLFDANISPCRFCFGTYFGGAPFFSLPTRRTVGLPVYPFFRKFLINSSYIALTSLAALSSVM